MVRLERDGDVFTLQLDGGENRFGSETVRAMNEALDEVVAAGSPAALVTTGTGKFYSNGLDLDEMMSDGGARSGEYLHAVLALLARTLTFPTVTVAAVNGHAFGAGAQIAVAHDVRIMRADRGFFCMPEIDMRAPLHPLMTAILAARIPQPTVHEVITTGKRWGGEEAAARGIVDHAVSEADVLPRARQIAAELAAKADPALRTLKRGLYAHVVDLVDVPLSAVEGINT